MRTQTKITVLVLYLWAATASPAAAQVTIAPAPANNPGESHVRMNLDAVRGDRRVQVEGRAWDPDASIGSGVGAVHVWAHGPRGAVFLGAADLDLPGNHFALRSPVSLPPGLYAITAYVWLDRTGQWEGARTLPLVIR